MDTMDKTTLVHAWLGLLALTAAGILLGSGYGHASWLPLAVAALIWLKGAVVARYFINTSNVHPFIAWVVRIFTAFSPIALLVTDWLSH